LFQRQKEIDIVYCGSFKKYRGNSIEVIPTNRGNIYLNALRDCPNAVHTLMIKHECFERIGLFDENFHTFEDWDLWIRLAKHFKFDFVDEPLVIYHFHGQQMVMKLDRKILAGQMILEKHFDAICVLPDVLFWHYRKLLTRCSLAENYDQTLLYLIKAIIIKPFRLDTYLHLILMHINKPLQKKLIYKFGLVKIGDIYIV
jgi:GT2 family glycosyltransferase